MFNLKYHLILIIGFLFFTSCEKVFQAPQAETDNLSIFDEYVKLVREKYAMLEFKGVDIKLLDDSLRATINATTSDNELAAKIATITNRLRDGHSSFFAITADSFFFSSFDLYEGYPIAFDSTILYSHYITPANMEGLESSPGMEDRLTYGKLTQDHQIGYFRLPSFNVEISSEELETAFITIKDTKGLILDVRGNGGGDPALATTLASYFMSETTYTGFERFKTGPGSNDFTDSPSHVEPADSENKYTNPVVVLTDRGVYSATTTLAYNLDPLPQVTFIGQRTGGGSGSVADGYLANGWQWSLSTSEFIDYQDRHLDDGVDPDILVDFNPESTTKDEILERAILELQ